MKTMNGGALVAGLILCLSGGCVFWGHVETDNTVEVKPIHITIDVNVRVQKELADAFDDLDDRRARLAEKNAKKE
jgi:hypothetical protein